MTSKIVTSSERQSTRRKFFSHLTSVTLRVPKTSLSNFDRSSGAPFHAARRRTSTKTSTSKQTVEHLKGSRSRRARQSAARKQRSSTRRQWGGNNHTFGNIDNKTFKVTTQRLLIVSFPFRRPVREGHLAPAFIQRREKVGRFRHPGRVADEVVQAFHLQDLSRQLRETRVHVEREQLH